MKEVFSVLFPRSLFTFHFYVLFSSRRWVLMLIFALLPYAALANCWEEAGKQHGVAPKLLYAIASVESNLNPHAENVSHSATTGTTDIGLMQINSDWLLRLNRY